MNRPRKTFARVTANKKMQVVPPSSSVFIIFTIIIKKYNNYYAVPVLLIKLQKAIKLKNTKEFLKKKQITIKREIFLDPINVNSIVIALQNILYINFPWY